MATGHLLSRYLGARLLTCFTVTLCSAIISRWQCCFKKMEKLAAYPSLPSIGSIKRVESSRRLPSSRYGQPLAAVFGRWKGWIAEARPSDAKYDVSLRSGLFMHTYRIVGHFHPLKCSKLFKLSSCSPIFGAPKPYLQNVEKDVESLTKSKIF